MSTLPNKELSPEGQAKGRSLIVSGLVSVILMYVLYAVVKYSVGYGQVRTTILSSVYAQWQLEDWGHCMMVPFAALLIVYLERAKLQALGAKGAGSGFWILCVGFALYWIGFKADNIYLSYAAAQVLIAGLIIWFVGWNWMRVLAFPWLFLLFMWPLLFLESFISFPLRLLVSHAGVVILNLIGIDSVLNGTGILSAADPALHVSQGDRFAVDVALPCSGMRSLFALMMVSALYGYFTLKSPWCRLTLFLTSIPLAIVGNICRIVMLAIGTLTMGAVKAIGTLEHPSAFHMMAGYVVFVIALGGVILLTNAITRFDLQQDRRINSLIATKEIPLVQGIEGDPQQRMKDASNITLGLADKIPFGRVLVVMLMAGVTLTACFKGGTTKSISESGVLMSLPGQLLGMTGTPMSTSEGERAILPKDTEISKMQYKGYHSDILAVQIVLAGGEKRSIHRPEICLPAQGWTIEGESVIPVKLSNGHEIKVMRLTASRPILLPNGNKTELMNLFYYWFVGQGTTTPYHLQRILMTNFDMLFHNTNHRWAYVVVSAPVLKGLAPGGKNVEQIDVMMKEAVSELAPKIMKNP